MLSRSRMIWLLPPSPSHQQVVSLSQSSCVSLVKLSDGRGGRGWGRSQIIWQRESLVLYKSFILSAWLYYCCSEDCLQPAAASSIKLIKLMAKSLIEPMLEHCLILTGLIRSHHCSTRVVKQGDHQSKKTTLIDKVHTKPSQKTSVDPGNNLQCSGYCRLHILD